jgi:diacylglycerol O-acyltransferase / wax synthase
MSTYPMSAVDAAWYHMDGPANLAMVTAVMLTKAPLEFEKVREVYAHRMVEFDRFRQRVVETGFPIATPHWEDMPHFDIDQHLHHVVLPAPHDETALKAMLTDLASSPLDREQPLWQVHVIDGVGGGSALVTRYHHCIADGTAMKTVINRLFDVEPVAPGRRLSPAARPSADPVSRAPFKPALDAIERAVRRVGATANSAIDVVAHPRQAIDKAALVLGGAGMLLGELVKSADPQSPLKGDFGIRKHLAWSRPVAIKDVKVIGSQSGAKVNDVLVAAMTGALRVYLKRRGIDVSRTTVRAMVPVDLRPPERMGQLGNEFGLVVLELAVSSSRSSQRLAVTKARMDALKRSPEPVAMRFLFEIFGRGPKALEDLANYIFGSKASVVMTNVAGPSQTLYLTGVPIDRMMFWVPHPGRQLGMGISILSYRGMASLAVVADARLVPDPEAITEQFDREFETMMRAMKRRHANAQAKKPSLRKAGSRRTRPAPSPARPADARTMARKRAESPSTKSRKTAA